MIAGMTVRNAIAHIIPGVSLDTELEQVLAIEACRELLDSGSMPTDDVTDAFDNWYRDVWAQSTEGAKG